MRKLRFDDVHHMELIPMYTNRKPCGNTDSLRPSVKRINGWCVSRKLHPSFIILGNFRKFKFSTYLQITVELNHYRQLYRTSQIQINTYKYSCIKAYWFSSFRNALKDLFYQTKGHYWFVATYGEVKHFCCNTS